MGFKDAFKEVVPLIQNSNAHGISNTAAARNKWTRIYWAFATVMVVVPMMLFLIKRFDDYANAGLVISPFYAYSHEMEFPNITICSEQDMDVTNHYYSAFKIKKRNVGTIPPPLFWGFFKKSYFFHFFIFPYFQAQFT